MKRNGVDVRSEKARGELNLSTPGGQRFWLDTGSGVVFKMSVDCSGDEPYPLVQLDDPTLITGLSFSDLEGYILVHTREGLVYQINGSSFTLNQANFLRRSVVVGTYQD